MFGTSSSTIRDYVLFPLSVCLSYLDDDDDLDLRKPEIFLLKLCWAHLTFSKVRVVFVSSFPRWNWLLICVLEIFSFGCFWLPPKRHCSFICLRWAVSVYRRRRFVWWVPFTRWWWWPKSSNNNLIVIMVKDRLVWPVNMIIFKQRLFFDDHYWFVFLRQNFLALKSKIFDSHIENCCNWNWKTFVF